MLDSTALGLVCASCVLGLVSASRALVKASGDALPQGQGYPHPSPHVPLKPAKRSATPEHMLAEQVTAVPGSSLQLGVQGSVEMRQLGHNRQAQSPVVTASKVGRDRQA